MTMKTFTSKPQAEPVTFNIDEDEFEAIPSNQLPGGVVNEYFKKVSKGEVFEAHEELFKFVLTEESYKIFQERYTTKNDKPITITMLGEVAAWLLGSVYMGEAGDTDQEAASSSGQPKKRGRGSTAGAASVA